MTPDGYLEPKWIVAIVLGGIYLIGIGVSRIQYSEDRIPGWAVFSWPLYAVVIAYTGLRAELHSECPMSRRSRFCAKCGKKK